MVDEKKGKKEEAPAGADVDSEKGDEPGTDEPTERERAFDERIKTLERDQASRKIGGSLEAGQTVVDEKKEETPAELVKRIDAGLIDKPKE